MHLLIKSNETASKVTATISVEVINYWSFRELTCHTPRTLNLLISNTKSNSSVLFPHKSVLDKI